MHRSGMNIERNKLVRGVLLEVKAMALIIEQDANHEIIPDKTIY